MTSYIISYELHDEHREPALLAALEVFEDRCHALASVWFVCSPWSAEQIQSHLGHYLGPDDSLVVEPVPENQGWSGWVGEDVREWLREHLADDTGSAPGTVVSVRRTNRPLEHSPAQGWADIPGSTTVATEFSLARPQDRYEYATSRAGSENGFKAENEYFYLRKITPVNHRVVEQAAGSGRFSRRPLAAPTGS